MQFFKEFNDKLKHFNDKSITTSNISKRSDVSMINM